MRAILASVFMLLVTHGQASALDIAITYLHVEQKARPTLSNLDPAPDDLGIAGAQLAISENNTTGRFLNQIFALNTVSITPENLYSSDTKRLSTLSPYVVTDATGKALLAIADLAAGQDAIVFSVADPSVALRSADCRANLFHTNSSYAMRADALSQFLLFRRWGKTALITGGHPDDQAFAAAIESSLNKFGLPKPKRKSWTFDADMRRSASQEVPLFTKELGAYDVLLIADEANDFARYIPYNTWLARPVAGATGMQAKAWDRTVEQWGAAQLQGRFFEQTGRDMRSQDYASWVAIRSIGEAVIRTSTADAQTIGSYMLSEDFELGGFKGRPLSYRSWNGQLRQPMPIVHGDAMIAQAPLEGFLHQHNELDTLGLDAPESECRAFQEN
ncbi:MAG: ABC transporter substrate binding protein (PQQ-dependent alcohol dehydrogenase system) [Halocynthiibacter sp.]|jgi:ABC transporter substrate binding protein (PQQ-dependent alcohol dehydrogenase system)